MKEEEGNRAMEWGTGVRKDLICKEGASLNKANVIQETY